MLDFPVILWFRQDLRLQDNPAYHAALESGSPILPVFILDDDNAGPWKRGAASRWWLYHSLSSLNKSLHGTLAIFRGDATKIIPELVDAACAHAVFWNRCYEPWRMARDSRIKTGLEQASIAVKSSNASLLYEPWTVNKDDGTPYKVFTPFFRKGCLGRGEPPAPLGLPHHVPTFFPRLKQSLHIDDLDLLPSIKWDKGFHDVWIPGEHGARTRLGQFLDHELKGYKEGRNHPDRENVSRLSPHLHFGEISPRTAWHAVRHAMESDPAVETDGDCFLSELGWREFSYSLLYTNPDMPTKPLQSKFASFPWDKNDTALRAWQMGKTGYPIVDAGMRQLWQTGWMHNRVRMIVASFLIKDLMLPWTAGEEWFWDTLVDADLANNAASWQWVAGCGADAAPYFRIFNPVTQGTKFDPDGDYIRAFVPELAALPTKYIHEPWTAPDNVLKQCGVELGQTYPMPIVDHKAAREHALAVFKGL
ncbi:cryptochrome/photolyase family protein [Micavibrio aeruginosavorus]|uniref:cryptochrome/photolyase family protein n=1 Tax=Micavibrio aeruginosavorus TaxID=349221 RepID=UPI003F4ADFEA